MTGLSLEAEVGLAPWGDGKGSVVVLGLEGGPRLLGPGSTLTVGEGPKMFTIAMCGPGGTTHLEESLQAGFDRAVAERDQLRRDRADWEQRLGTALRELHDANREVDVLRDARQESDRRARQAIAEAVVLREKHDELLLLVRSHHHPAQTGCDPCEAVGLPYAEPPEPGEGARRPTRISDALLAEGAALITSGALTPSPALGEQLANAEERLELARRALIADGWFTESQVGPDVAPRITEILTHYRSTIDRLAGELEVARRG